MSRRTAFVEAYQKFFEDPVGYLAIPDHLDLVATLERMNPKEVEGTCKDLEKLKIQIGTVKGPLDPNKINQDLFKILPRLNSLAWRRYGEPAGQSKKKSHHHAVR